MIAQVAFRRDFVRLRNASYGGVQFWKLNRHNASKKLTKSTDDVNGSESGYTRILTYKVKSHLHPTIALGFCRIAFGLTRKDGMVNIRPDVIRVLHEAGDEDYRLLVEWCGRTTSYLHATWKIWLWWNFGGDLVVKFWSRENCPITIPNGLKKYEASLGEQLPSISERRAYLISEIKVFSAFSTDFSATTVDDFHAEMPIAARFVIVWKPSIADCANSSLGWFWSVDRRAAEILHFCCFLDRINSSKQAGEGFARSVNPKLKIRSKPPSPPTTAGQLSAIAKKATQRQNLWRCRKKVTYSRIFESDSTILPKRLFFGSLFRRGWWFWSGLVGKFEASDLTRSCDPKLKTSGGYL